MKAPSRIITSAIKAIPLIACLPALSPQIANALPYSWDPMQTPATPSGGAGTWDTSSTFWANGGSDSAWANTGTDNAIFAGTAGTVTLGGTTINTSGLTFNTDDYIITGGTLNFSGATPTIDGGSPADLNSTLTGTNGLILSGTGTLSINNASNTLSGGIQLNSGSRLTTNTAGSLGTNVLTLNGGRFLPRTSLSNNILVSADSDIDVATVGSTYTMDNLSIGNQQLSLVVSSSVSNGNVSFGNTTLTGDATIRTNKGSSSRNEGTSPSATFSSVTVGDSVSTGTTTTFALTSVGSGVNRSRAMSLNGMLSDNASDATKKLALEISAGSYGNLTVNVGGANTYTGATTITGRSSSNSSIKASATLRLTTGNDRLPTGTNLTVNGGEGGVGILDLNSHNQTVGALNGGSGIDRGYVTNNDSGSGTATLTVSSTTTDSTFDGLIQDGSTAKVALTKAGTGTSLTLTSAHTYTGATTVNAGTLLVNGSTTGSAVTLNNTGSTLGGTGTITPGAVKGLTVSTGAIVAPGVNGATGQLTLALNNTGDFATFASGAKFVFELDAPGASDVLAFTGMTLGVQDATFNSNVIDFTDLGGLAAGNYTLFTFDAANAYSGTLAIGTGLESFGGSSFSYNANSIVLNVVPEPATSGLLAFGLTTALLLRRRKA